MRVALVVLALLIACGKKKDTPAPEPAAGSAPAKAEPAAATPPSSGLAIIHNVAELSGTYDRVLAQLARADEPTTTIAFVRGCPRLDCTTWQNDAIASTCPKAYVATVKLALDKPGKVRVPMSFAGPADNPSTATLDEVRLELTALGTDGVAGTASQKTTESEVKGQFTAEVCPRT